MTLRVLLAGGGTAGHINPLLALADELTSRPGGAEVLVVGTADGLEARLVPQRGYRLASIPRVPFPRRPNAAAVRFPRDYRRAVGQAGRLIAEHGADVVVGFGGYVSTPAYRAAFSARVPVVIHEQNMRPGLANRYGARRAAAVGLTFSETPLRARRGATEHTGLPLRPDLATLAQADEAARRQRRIEAGERFGIDPDRPVLVVTGGSLGAQQINLAMAGAASAVTAAGIQVLHAAGRGKTETVAAAAQAAGRDYHLVEYLDDMAAAYALADLVIGRSGAGTVCEQAALGLPGIYVPLPHGNGEQRLNVRSLEQAGGAVVIDDAHFTPEAVRSEAIGLIQDAPRLAQMAQAARSEGIVDGAARLADLVLAAAGVGS